MTSDSFDLDAYLARIGCSRTVAPDLDTLRAIHAAHPAAIPFENLDPLLGHPVRLDLGALQAKLVGGRRGGYCFEQNALLAAALERLGFQVTPLAARVRWMTPPDRPEGSRSHMLLLVDLPDGRWLADVGFGGYLLGDPVRFAPNVQQRTSSGTVRIVEDRSSFTLQASLPSGWQDVYRFTLEPQLPIDYVVANWYTSTYPTSFFTQHLLVQNVTATGRTSLVDARFTERPFEGPAVERVLTSPDELAEVLTQVFAITPPVEPVEIWARLPKG